MNPLLLSALGAVVRFFLTSLATILVQKGIWTQEQSSAYVGAAAAGIAIGAATLAWSLWQKYGSRLKLVTALSMHTASTENAVDKKIAAGGALPSAMTPKDEVPKSVKIEKKEGE